VICLPYQSLLSQAGVPGGANFIGVNPAVTRSDLSRAVMEATAYALRTTLARLENMGWQLRELRATGGPTRSALWNQITADICGSRLYVSKIDCGAAYGAALLAGMAVGLFSLDRNGAARSAINRDLQCVEPRVDLFPVYQSIYERFTSLLSMLQQR